MEDPTPFTIKQGIYRHTKSGKEYEVLGIELETETNEKLVIYKTLYENDFQLFARPYRMFVEQTEINGSTQPRFTLITPQ
jgi:hypothetical protein